LSIELVNGRSVLSLPMTDVDLKCAVNDNLLK